MHTKTAELNRGVIFPRWIENLLWALIALLFVYTAWSSFGYDDEYYNVRVVTEYSLGGMINHTQTSDLHPPLSYIVNYLLYHTTGNWPVVRLCSALFFLVALFFTTRRVEDRIARISILLLLGLNPTVLLWVTGLRWYAYMVPLLMLWAIVPANGKWYHWPKFFVYLLVVCYTGYAGLFLAVPYFILYWLKDRRTVWQKVRAVCLYGALFMAAYGYQLYIFLTVHSKINLMDESNKQVFDLKASLSAIISSLASNQGVFPLSWSGLCAIAGAAFFYVGALLGYKKVLKEQQWIIFLVTGFLFLITGIAGKVRNLVLLEPSRTRVFSTVLATGRKWLWAGMVLMLLGNAAGICHVITHQQTTKNAWNIPLEKVLTTMDSKEIKGRKEVYFTYHPTFTFYQVNRKKNLVSFYNTLYFDSTRLPPNYQTLLSDTAAKTDYTFILTYPGQSIPDNIHQRMVGAMRTVTADSIQHLFFGRDADYKLKQRFFPGYPEYAVEVFKYYGVHSFDSSSLRVWDTGGKN